MLARRRTSTVVIACALMFSAAVFAACGADGRPGLATASAASPFPAYPAGSHAALKMIWGPNTLPNGSSAFPVYRKLGVDVLQAQLSWRATATARPTSPTDPNDPAYHWPAALDTTVAQAKRSHIAVAIMVRETPNWANGGRGSAQVPNDDADYANFLKAATLRYPTVHHWMIWGEPTRKGNFAPMPVNSPIGPRRYALLLDAAYGALKAQGADNVVIGGMTWTLGQVTPSDFVKWLRLPDGRPPRMDMYGHNPFSTRFPDITDSTYYRGLRDINDVDTFHNELSRAYGGHPPKLWLSEFTVASDRANRGFDFSVSRKAQAKWVTAAYRLADGLPYVTGLGWFDLYDEVSHDKRSLTNGLMDQRGHPKPAFAAYRRAR